MHAPRPWRRGGVVTQRTANPCTPVRFRPSPPSLSRKCNAPFYKVFTGAQGTLPDRLSDIIGSGIHQNGSSSPCDMMIPRLGDRASPGYRAWLHGARRPSSEAPDAVGEIRCREPAATTSRCALRTMSARPKRAGAPFTDPVWRPMHFRADHSPGIVFPLS